MRQVYLDHAATTPVHPEVAREMQRFLTDDFGNPSSIHAWGRRTRQALEEARAAVAAAIGAAEAREVTFTSGGTEADNMALLGTARARRDEGRHLIVSAIEHHAVLDAAAVLENEGFAVTYLPVDRKGQVQPETLAAALRHDTILVSIMLANNEIGTIQPVPRLAAMARERGVPFHTDAVQALGKMRVDVASLGVDMLSISAHKIYGPKGVGALWVRRGFELDPIHFGGAQERRLRPGTENLPGIVGFGRAATLVAERWQARAQREQELRDRLLAGIEARLPQARLLGHRRQRLPHHLKVAFPGLDGEALVLNMDMKGIAVSTGAACSSGSLEPSHVLLALDLPAEWVQGALRMTLGRDNDADDVAYVVESLVQVVRRLEGSRPELARDERG